MIFDNKRKCGQLMMIQTFSSKCKNEWCSKNNEDFQNFFRHLEFLYPEKLNSGKVPYIFVFDTTEVGMVNMKYSNKNDDFIKELKRQENQYLKGSIIIVKNKYIKFLLKFIFLCRNL